MLGYRHSLFRPILLQLAFGMDAGVLSSGPHACMKIILLTELFLLGMVVPSAKGVTPLLRLKRPPYTCQMHGQVFSKGAFSFYPEDLGKGLQSVKLYGELESSQFSLLV